MAKENQNDSDIRQLETKLGYVFESKAWLKQALVHRSYHSQHNERLEFLGDGLLNFVIGEALFLSLDSAEGELSSLRAHFVRQETLAEIAKELMLGRYLYLGMGERKAGGAQRDSLLSDCLEAIIAAVYQDGGFDAARALVLRLYAERLYAAQQISAENLKQDFKGAKSRLQEYLQARKKALPIYELVAVTGQDHLQQFKIACIVGRLKTYGMGSSRKRAEHEAATKMLEKL